MITSITCLSYEAVLERAMHYRLPDNAFVVSIVNPEEEPIFEEDTDRIITLKFHDLDPESLVDPERDPNSVFMTEDDAQRIVAYVLRFHERSEAWECLINCMAGISRSGVVGTFVQTVAGIPREQFITANPGLHPNPYVLKLLMREFAGATPSLKIQASSRGPQ